MLKFDKSFIIDNINKRAIREAFIKYEIENYRNSVQKIIDCNRLNHINSYYILDMKFIYMNNGGGRKYLKNQEIELIREITSNI